MTDSLLSEIYAFAQNYHSKDKSGHGFDHIRRVYENACRLLEKEKKADAFVVKAAALLHDVDDHKLGGFRHGRLLLRQRQNQLFIRKIAIYPIVDNLIVNIEKSFSVIKSLLL